MSKQEVEKYDETQDDWLKGAICPGKKLSWRSLGHGSFEDMDKANTEDGSYHVLSTLTCSFSQL